LAGGHPWEQEEVAQEQFAEKACLQARVKRVTADKKGLLVVHRNRDIAVQKPLGMEAFELFQNLMKIKQLPLLYIIMKSTFSSGFPPLVVSSVVMMYSGVFYNQCLRFSITNVYNELLGYKR
jgi:hypothetical protein